MIPTIPSFQGIKRSIQYIDSHPHKPIFYPSGSYDGSNGIKITWSGNQVKYNTTQNLLECHQESARARTLDRRLSVSVIIHILFGFAVFYEL